MRTRPARARPSTRVDSRHPVRHAKRVPAMDNKDWSALADYVRRRAKGLGYESREQLAEAMKLRPATVGKIYRGESVSPETLDALDDALLLKPGGAARVLNSEKPVELDPAGTDVTEDPTESDTRDEVSSDGAAFVRQLRYLRDNSRDQAAFIATVLLLIGEPQDAS